MSERTDHGFRIGAIEATALAEWSGGSALRIEAGAMRFDVQATPKGQKVYLVFEDGRRTHVRLILPNGDEVAIGWYGKYGGSVSRYRNGEYGGGFMLEPR